jgi:hypothetical protein
VHQKAETSGFFFASSPERAQPGQTKRRVFRSWNEVHRVSAKDWADEEGRGGEDKRYVRVVRGVSKNPVSFSKSTPLSSSTLLKSTSGRRRRCTEVRERGSRSIFPQPRLAPDP